MSSALEVWGDGPPRWFKGDGCTGVRDRILGVDVAPACRLHDWEYRVAGGGFNAPSLHALNLHVPTGGGFKWEGAGVYVCNPLGVWQRAADKAPSRLAADWRFGYNTARLLRDGGVWDWYASLRAAVRVVGVRLMGKGRGWRRWARIAAVAGGLGALAWFGGPWLAREHPWVAVTSFLLLAVAVAEDFK